MSDSPTVRERHITVRALLLGDRIETAGLERNDVLSKVPLAFRAGEYGIVALFRYGVAVLFAMSPLEEEEVIRRLDGRVIGPIAPREEETFQIEIAPDKDDQLTPTGIIAVRALTTEHALLIADALATSVVLAHDEKNVAKVFDVISADCTRVGGAWPHAGRPPRDPKAHRKSVACPTSRLWPRSRSGKTGCSVGAARSRALLREARRRIRIERAR